MGESRRNHFGGGVGETDEIQFAQSHASPEREAFVPPCFNHRTATQARQSGNHYRPRRREGKAGLS